MTNEEALLMALNGAEVNPEATFQPQNNKQAYLAYAVGLLTDPDALPEPRTNEEALLLQLCLNGTGGGEDYEITNCTHLFYEGAKIDAAELLFKYIPYISNASRMFYRAGYTYGSNSANPVLPIADLLALLPGSFLGKLKKATTCQEMFGYAWGLVSFPDITFENKGVYQEMFAHAEKLVSVGDFHVPGFTTTAQYSGFYGLFSGCTALESVGDITADDSTKCDCGMMFYQCSALKKLGALNFKPTRTVNMFQDCRGLEEIPQIDLSGCTEVSSMFYGCSNMAGTINLGALKASSISSMFNGCKKIEEILDVRIITTNNAYFSNAFPKGTSEAPAALRRLTFHPDCSFPGANGGITISYCSLQREAMVELFNSLPDISGSNSSSSYKTITITGNPCVKDGTLTAEDRAIATNKGWTLVE